jgi:hypothetical protein
MPPPSVASPCVKVVGFEIFSGRSSRFLLQMHGLDGVHGRKHESSLSLRGRSLGQALLPGGESL